jgi:glycosyltransferase involved in cell wall biosynthesis
MTRRHITIVTPCYQEAGNIREMAHAVREVMATRPGYAYEHLFIDNGSTDGTRDLLRQLAADDDRVRVILNARNFGQVRSGYHALLQSRGEAVICLVCDFQDPPELITTFLDQWERGAKLVLGVKTEADESRFMYGFRSAYYRWLARIADVKVVQHATGFGLYDRQVIEDLRRIDDPYPFFRGLLAEIGYSPVLIPYRQPARRAGTTSQTFWTLYDVALLGVVSHSRLPLRLAVIVGVVCALLSLLTGFSYLVYKLAFWNQFSVGIAPALIGIFFLSAVQLIFIGLVGEYLGAVWTHVRKHPHVFEEERINF